ncbi:MAG: DMT family transporter [Limisphaerales bacterium]
MNVTQARGLAALLLGAVCIGFAPLWVRWSETGAVATAFHRLLLALPVLAVWAARDRSAKSVPWTSADRLWTLAAGAFFALDLAAWHLAIRFTSVANATLLANFAPIFVTAGAWIFLREPVGTRFAAGMAVAFGGAWLLTGASFFSGSSRAEGDVLGLITAAFYGAYQLCVARLRRRHPSGRILFFGSLTSIPLLGFFALALDEKILPDTARGWCVLIGLAATAQVFGQGLITHGFAHLPAGYSSLVLLVQPLVAAGAAWILLSESMTGPQLLGGLILLAGIVLARQGAAPLTPSPIASPSPPPDPTGSPGSTDGNCAGAPLPRR